MKHFELNGQIRQVGNKAVIKAFRKQGLVPCNLYGAGMENVLFTVSEKDLKGLLYTPASHIVDLNLDGKVYMAVLHELQFHPVTDACLHIDFLAVDEKKPVAIDVPLNLFGHPVGVQAGGKFTQLARKVRISALLENLPDQLDVDITPLGLDKRLTVGELKFDGINILSDKNTIICRVKTTRAMQQAAADAAKNA
ncbi:MAG: 50S ribosomal protein L25 [Bacteroidales bacterium]|jgi:large subunit ribosomal protein L25|nr:50S ribosomal protein L25 [Bacteroidales bacterium]